MTSYNGIGVYSNRKESAHGSPRCPGDRTWRVSYQFVEGVIDLVQHGRDVRLDALRKLHTDNGDMVGSISHAIAYRVWDLLCLGCV